jgi:hypothetical protein
VQQEIIDVIQKNLPAQVGQALQKELARIPVLEKDLDGKEAESLRLAALLEAEKRMNVESATARQAADAILKREADVAEAERNRKVFELQAKLLAAEFANIKLFEFVGLLVRAPAFKETILTSGSIPVKTGNGGYESVNQHCTSSSTETTRTTE